MHPHFRFSVTLPKQRTYFAKTTLFNFRRLYNFKSTTCIDCVSCITVLNCVEVSSNVLDNEINIFNVRKTKHNNTTQTNQNVVQNTR